MRNFAPKPNMNLVILRKNWDCFCQTNCLLARGQRINTETFHHSTTSITGATGICIRRLQLSIDFRTGHLKQTKEFGLFVDPVKNDLCHDYLSRLAIA